MTEFSKIEDWFWKDFSTTSSTNDELKKLLPLAKGIKKLVITAKEQTAGRGRLDHKWISMSGNLFMSLGISWNLQDIAILSLISSLALYQTIKSYSPKAEILLKWPNDVFIERKKVSGILIESVAPSFAVVGIGINIIQTPKLEQQPLYLPTSLKEHGINTDRLDFMKNYLSFFDKTISLFHQQGSSAIINEWQQKALALGDNITVKTAKEEIFGKFLGLDNNGMLLLQTDNSIRTISTGDISF
jgi:BirA family biotin operon repressor/biotin-[acetyl-CoA-carboxylase] ligase